MITIISKDYCPFCNSAKEFLKSIDKEYIEINVSEDSEKLAEIIQISGMMTVPQIFDGEIKSENLIWGYDDMIEKYKSGKIFQ